MRDQDGMMKGPKVLGRHDIVVVEVVVLVVGTARGDAERVLAERLEEGRLGCLQKEVDGIHTQTAGTISVVRGHTGIDGNRLGQGGQAFAEVDGVLGPLGDIVGRFQRSLDESTVAIGLDLGVVEEQVALSGCETAFFDEEANEVGKVNYESKVYKKER